MATIQIFLQETGRLWRKRVNSEASDRSSSLNRLRLRIAPTQNGTSQMTQPRKAERIRSLMSAQVTFANAPSVSCIVKNFSPAGVRLEIPDGMPLPNEFDLHIPHKGRTYHARVAWRGEGIVGAEFVEPGETARRQAVENEGDRLDRLMLENARLRAKVLLLKQRIAELSGEA